MEKLEVNGKAAVKIFATVEHETQSAYLLDCEGDKEWFPRSAVEVNKEEETALIQEWLYEQKFGS